MRHHGESADMVLLTRSPGYWTIPPPGKGGKGFGDGHGGLVEAGHALADGLRKALEWLKMRATL